MSVLSKLLGSHFRILPYNCYETVHTWHPSCIASSLIITQHAFKDSFKIYSTLYIIATILKRPKFKDIDYGRLVKDILRSTLFLTSNGFFFIASICFLRHALGFFVLPTFFLNGVIASFISILIERKGRRGMLALYLTNLASEVAFKMLVHRKIVHPLKYGEVLIFAFVVAGYFFMLKTENLNSYTSGAIKSVFGVKDAKTEEKKPFSSFPFRYFPKIFLYLLQLLRRLSVKSKLCTHSHSCLSVGVEGFLQNFTLAFVASSVLKFVSSLPSLIKRPMQLGQILFNKKSFGLPLFVGCLPLVYNASSCLMRRLFGTDSVAVHTISGFLAGLSMYFYPSVSVSMYLLWKLIESFYFKGVENGWLPHFPNADIIIYTFSTAFVLFAAVLEPHAIRPGYKKFLMNLTGNKAGQLNRNLLDVYGFGSSIAFHKFRAILNPLYVTMNQSLLP